MAQESSGSEVSKKIRSAIKAKLEELGAFVDEELPDYIMVMIANKKSRDQMTEDLNLFLGKNSTVFTKWLHEILERLQTLSRSLHDKDRATSADKKRVKKAAESEKKSKSADAERTKSASSSKHKKEHRSAEKDRSRRDRKRDKDSKGGRKEKRTSDSKASATKAKKRTKDEEPADIASSSSTQQRVVLPAPAQEKEQLQMDKTPETEADDAAPPQTKTETQTTMGGTNQDQLTSVAVENATDTMDAKVDTDPAVTTTPTETGDQPKNDADDTMAQPTQRKRITAPSPPPSSKTPRNVVRVKPMQREKKSPSAPLTAPLSSTVVVRQNVSPIVSSSTTAAADHDVEPITGRRSRSYVAKKPKSDEETTKEPASVAKVTKRKITVPVHTQPKKSIFLKAMHDASKPPATISASAISHTKIPTATDSKTEEMIEEKPKSRDHKTRRMIEIDDDEQQEDIEEDSESGDGGEHRRRGKHGRRSRHVSKHRSGSRSSHKKKTRLTKEHKEISRTSKRRRVEVVSEETEETKRKVVVKSKPEGPRFVVTMEGLSDRFMERVAKKEQEVTPASTDTILTTETTTEAATTYHPDSAAQEPVVPVPSTVEVTGTIIGRQQTLVEQQPSATTEVAPISQFGPPLLALPQANSSNVLHAQPTVGYMPGDESLQPLPAAKMVPIDAETLQSLLQIAPVSISLDDDEDEEEIDASGDSYCSGSFVPGSLQGDDEQETNGAKLTENKLVAEKCRFWPNCRGLDDCPYIHPSKPCRSFPNCSFGARCLYVHPVCRFDANCHRPKCPFTHTTKQQPKSQSPSTGQGPPPPPPPSSRGFPGLPVPCRFGKKCASPVCPFQHPAKTTSQCRFGTACTNNSCQFAHSSGFHRSASAAGVSSAEQLPVKPRPLVDTSKFSKFKWVARVASENALKQQATTSVAATDETTQSVTALSANEDSIASVTSASSE